MIILMLLRWRKNSSDVIINYNYYNYTTSKGLYSKCSGLCTIFSNNYAYTVGKLVVDTV